MRNPIILLLILTCYCYKVSAVNTNLLQIIPTKEEYQNYQFEHNNKVEFGSFKYGSENVVIPNLTLSEKISTNLKSLDLDDQLYQPNFIVRIAPVSFGFQIDRKVHMMYRTQKTEYIIHLTHLFPHFTMEKRLDNNSTLFAGITLDLAKVDKTPYNVSLDTNLILYPQISIGPRFHFNLQRRKLLDKRIDYYSSPYLEFPATIAYMTYVGPMIKIGALLGYQRTILRKLFINAAIGPSLYFINNVQYFCIAGQLNLGFILSKS